MTFFLKAAAKQQSVPAPRKLSQAEIAAVSGGLNPQPLPPVNDPHERAMRQR